MKTTWMTGLAYFLGIFLSLEANEKPLPPSMQKIMQLDKYRHANWGVYAKDSATGEVIYDYNSNQLFLPGSTTKIFSVAALLQAYGDDYRYKTPVYAKGIMENGILHGDLILVGQGDLTFGGRQEIDGDTIAFTKMDHIYANDIPGAVMTPQNPLNALNALSRAIREKGIKLVDGDVIIDDSLFQQTNKRGMILSPIMLNENLIDIEFQPSEVGTMAHLKWRPVVEGYSIKNEVKTVEKGGKVQIDISSDESGQNIVVKGTLPEDEHHILRTFSIKDPKAFAHSAFVQSLKTVGITVQPPPKGVKKSSGSLQEMEPIAVWTSPPLSEYAKLILKVSHNLGADLIPLMLAVKVGKNSFDEGMIELGKFTTEMVKVSPDSFVFIDGAGGDQNRLTPQASVKLLEYVKSWPAERFKKFDQALPILGKDGSLEDVAKSSSAVGKVHAKPGTGVAFNLATQQFFLTTQALAGYIEGKNGHLIEFSIAVNNGIMPQITDIFPIFEDEGQMTVIMYEQ